MKHEKSTIDKLDTIMENVVLGFLWLVMVVTLLGTII